MKRNTKNLGVFVMVVAITVFTAVAMASADDQGGKKFIEGKYAFAGVATYFFSLGGFDEQFAPSQGLYKARTGMCEGFYVFHKDGTGEYQSECDCFDVAGPGFKDGLTSANINFMFQYTLDKGKITFSYVPGSWVTTNVYDPDVPGTTVYGKLTGPWYGRISANGENLVVTYTIPNKWIPTEDKDNQILIPLEIVCNIADHGFRVEE